MERNKFIEKARLIHGYRYQYPNLKDKITQKDTIDILFEGEIYKQKVIKHLLGKRPERKVKNKTTEEFINESKKVWGDKYDYSSTEYTNSTTKVRIMFSGIIYEQFPNSHLAGHSPEKIIKTSEELKLEKEIIKFLNKYDIGYQKQKLFNNLIFNFYIPTMRCCIVFEKDIIKSNYCEENFIELIIIEHQVNDIYQILWENLKFHIKRLKLH